MLDDGSAVGDQLGLRPELAGVVVGDALRVGDEGVRQAHGRLLGAAVVLLAGGAPLGPLPLQPVDVRGHRDAGRPQHGQERRVGAVEDEGDVGAVGDQVHRGDAGVGQRVERPLLDRGQRHELHPEVAGHRLLDVALTAVDAHVVATSGQAASDLLDGRLETPVPSRHPPCSEHGNRQHRTFPPHQNSVLGRA